MGYADSLDLVGKNSRQRKVREIRVDTREQDAVTLNLLQGLGYTTDRHAMLVVVQIRQLAEAVERGVVVGMAGEVQGQVGQERAGRRCLVGRRKSTPVVAGVTRPQG